MTTGSPLADSTATDTADRDLAARAVAGERAAIEDLVRRHQAWIYNIAVHMLAHPHDAEDATREILIKVITRLSSFEDWRAQVMLRELFANAPLAASFRESRRTRARSR